MITEWNGDGINTKIRAAAARGVFAGIRIIEKETVRQILNTPKTGKLYRRRGIVHQASAPGEAPASDTGRLVNSRTIEDYPSDLKGVLTYRTEYAAFLEFGTAKMEARPFADLSVKAKRDEVFNTVQMEIRAAL